MTRRGVTTRGGSRRQIHESPRRNMTAHDGLARPSARRVTLLRSSDMIADRAPARAVRMYAAVPAPHRVTLRPASLVFAHRQRRVVSRFAPR